MGFNERQILFTLLLTGNGEDIGLKGTIPPEIFSLPYLEELDLGFHLDDPRKRGNLEGPIPDAIFNAKRMRVLDLQKQQISGEIPNAFYNTLLREAYLDGNQMTGSITSAIQNMQNLIHFTASHNPFDRQHLSPGFGEISDLKTLGLTNANLVGPVPESFKKLISIRELYFSDNAMTGDITFLKGYEDLEKVTLNSNVFTGDIPDELWNKTKLEIANLEDNRFTGTIPDSIGQMSMLKSKSTCFSFCSFPFNFMIKVLKLTRICFHKLKALRLANNNLTGTIPVSIKNLANLEILTLQRNNFATGSSIPKELCEQGTRILIPRRGVECPGGCCEML